MGVCQKEGKTARGLERKVFDVDHPAHCGSHELVICGEPFPDEESHRRVTTSKKISNFSGA